MATELVPGSSFIRLGMIVKFYYEIELINDADDGCRTDHRWQTLVQSF